MHTGHERGIQSHRWGRHLWQSWHQGYKTYQQLYFTDTVPTHWYNYCCPKFCKEHQGKRHYGSISLNPAARSWWRTIWGALGLPIGCWETKFLEKSTWADIAYAIHQCTPFSVVPWKSYALAIWQIDRYLLGTKDKAILLDPKGNDFVVWCDADFFGNWNKDTLWEYGVWSCIFLPL